jgi:Lrp/AsnC family leucine-responsive transcriptional regulator
MDKIDLEILHTLQESGRITNSDLAKKVGLSAPSVLERVRKLEESDVITGYSARIDPKKVGRGQVCFVAISLALHQIGSIKEFQRRIERIPEVIECHHITGEEDFLLRVNVRDMQHYEQLLLSQLTKIPGTSKIKTMVVLSPLKTGSKITIDPDEFNAADLGRNKSRQSVRGNRNSS